MNFLRAWGCLTGALLGTAAWASPLPASLIQSRPAQLRLSHEIVSLPGSENMGLAGVSYLINTTPGTYLGLSAYGATGGSRGGFFTGGGTLGTGVRLGRASLDAGLFVGGGGGGAAPQGGGLMLRPHLGLSYDLGAYRWGVGAAWVKFPNGAIDSKQVFLSLGIPFEVLYADRAYAWELLEPTSGFAVQASQLKTTWGRYQPAEGAKTTAGTAQSAFDTLGFAYQRELSGGWFAEIEAAGASAGQSDGYAEVLAGVGWQTRLPVPSTQLRMSLALGAAGGGSVDTAGGGIARAKLGLHKDLGRQFGVGVNLARSASAGRFAANHVSVDLTYRLGDIGRGSEAVSMRLQPWDIVASHQSYRQAQRKSGARRDVDLVGIKLARPLNERWYLTGQAYGAYDGEAGGYATGLWGAGLGWPLTQRSRIHAELLVGAGGGGGVASGGGALWQAQVGASYQLTRSGLIQLEWGRVRAPSGELNADLVNLNWVYRFARPEASH